jgi:DNA invertase Pin-like site-specific DNA recombinase
MKSTNNPTLGILRENNIRALAIVRVSTAEQAHEERFSIPHQRTHITEECRHRGLDLVHFFEFVQSGAKVLSDSSKERAEIIRYIKEYDIRVVIVHELDRLARSMLDTLLFVDQLDKLGVAFISIHDGFDTSTAQGQLQMHILAAFAEYFRKQLASKVLGGMIERAKEGKHLGRRPFGYDFGDSSYVAIEDEARIVRMVYDMFLNQNLGLRAIANHLNGMGLKTQRGLPWSHQTTQAILDNEVYTGTFVWNDIRVEGSHPAIIDRETWERVQLRRRRKRELGGRAQNSFFLLSGLLRCGICKEATLVGRTAYKYNRPYRYYTCNNYASRGTSTCTGGYNRAEVLEKMVLDDIREIAVNETPVINKEMVPSDVDILKEELQLKERELDRLKAMLVRAAEAYERGDYDLDLFSQRKGAISNTKAAVEKDIQQLRARIDGRFTPEEMERRAMARAENARAVIEEKDPVKMKVKLQELIDHIEVRSAESITIIYRG